MDSHSLIIDTQIAKKFEQIEISSDLSTKSKKVYESMKSTCSNKFWIAQSLT
jgi:hypothetical protein